MTFNNITIELYLNDVWTDITSNVVSSNGVQITPRIDGTFLVGTFDAWLTIEYVAAYTPLRITYNSNVTYLVCSSTSSKYMLNNNTYYHTFDIFEATALLCNFIVGSKSFSITGTNKKDIDKVNILRTLMQNKYGITITNNITGLTNEREFTFGAGTTLFDALSTILADYDCIPIITTITSSTAFTISCLNKNNYTTISYNSSEIVSVVNKQDMDNYCKYLESESKNVVDRTNTTKWTDISVRAEDILINADTCCLLLPANVEKISKIETSCTNWGFQVVLDSTVYNNRYELIERCTDGSAHIGNINTDWDSVFGYLAEYSLSPEDSGYEAEIIQDAKEATKIYHILRDLFHAMDGVYYSYNDLCDKLDAITWVAEVKEGESDNFYYEITASVSAQNANSVYSSKVDVSDYLLEKSEWDGLTKAEKPKYMYYESGTNVIKGLYDFYKDDFWGMITGSQVNPWYTYASELVGFEYNTTYNNSTGYCQCGLEGYNPMIATFDITATPTTDPIIINEKSPTLTPLNESAWKPYARSYDIKESTIEFDKLEERMQLSNDALGDVELEIELNNPTSTLPAFTNTQAYKMIYNNVTYYVVAFVINIKLDTLSIKYSLSRTYSKKAEVIGVDSQFEATPNPLNNIITRPIYIEATTGASVNLNEYNYLLFSFRVGNNYYQRYKRFSILNNGSTKLLYCEMIDQYTFDYNMIAAEGGNYYRNPIKYVNDYNELYSVAVSLVKLNMTVDKSKYLPLVSDFNDTVIDQIPLVHPGGNIALANTDIVVYKDARERLTFTIKLN